MQKGRCPRCFSDDVELVDYMGVKCIVCRACGFDETQLYEVYPEERGSQREKGKFTPYKAGGGGRARKL
ncbi:TPA: hypothetical protein HA372_04940 [Candidatus Woesearchaeota archaeon]|nr:MAG: hypothetical protein QT04_C0002G0006 [archaeon GW2011_AR11]MBS3111041.1 hypothetical protein [Candidatus Woesearchaeota archaeon]QBM01062.1 hypothetical protein [uncultured archaeon]HII65805.1 hypothetical protein [Candidatus Woesearchaeota archaeon]HIJ19004.1 hypothetical protein [Candidatus Woesearchaeota archaeon]